MRGGPRSFPQGFPCPVVLWILPGWLWLRIRGSHPLRPVFPGPFSCRRQIPYAVRTPVRTRSGLGSSAFARRYLRNRCFFLFLRVLRCFSSPGSPPHAMDSRTDDCGVHSRVSPFRHPRIDGYVLLPAAFRSLSRLSSALSAKASALCPSLLDLLSPAFLLSQKGGCVASALAYASAPLMVEHLLCSFDLLVFFNLGESYMLQKYISIEI